MNMIKFVDQYGQPFDRISKAEAKRIYDAGGKFTICPAKMHPGGMWQLDSQIDASVWLYENNTFAQFISNYTFVVCSPEVGTYPAFYKAV